MAVDVIDNNAFVQQIIDKGIAEANKRNTGEMGKDEFLNLLVLQLRYQDPLNPVDDKEFISQMAQFTTLEQMQSMNASNTAMKGFSMIGKYVTALLYDDYTGLRQTVEGHVESVVLKGSNTYCVVGGKEIPIDSIYNVADGYNPLNSSLSAYTGLIGYLVKGAAFDLTTGEVVGITGEVVSLVKGSYEDYAMLNGVNAVIAGINNKGEIIEDRAKLKEYLESAAGESDMAKRKIEVFITDENGKRVPISATLRNFVFDAETGKFKAVLDDVAAPVASVTSIQKAEQAVKQTSERDANEGDGEGTGKTGGAGVAGDSGETGGADGANENGGADGNENAGGIGGAEGNEAGGGDGLENADAADGAEAWP